MNSFINQITQFTKHKSLAFAKPTYLYALKDSLSPLSILNLKCKLLPTLLLHSCDTYKAWNVPFLSCDFEQGLA